MQPACEAALGGIVQCRRAERGREERGLDDRYARPVERASRLFEQLRRDSRCPRAGPILRIGNLSTVRV